MADQVCESCKRPILTMAKVYGRKVGFCVCSMHEGFAKPLYPAPDLSGFQLAPDRLVNRKLGLAVRFIRHWRPEDEAQLNATLIRDAQRLRKGLRWRNESQREFYAGWDAYEMSKAKMPYAERDLQTRAEVVELERWLRL